jgi:site-specific recombinase XerD
VSILRRLSDRLGGLLHATEEDLLEFIAHGDRRTETRRARLATVRKFYRWAWKRGLIESNPADDLPSIRRQPGIPRPCPDDVIAEALANATPRAGLAIMLAAFAGLRRSEIAGLTTADMTPQGIRVLGKGGKYRLVPMAPAIAEAVRDLPPGPLFPALRRGKGNPTTSDGISFMVERYLPQPWTLHTLRHRFATVAYQRTHDLRSVQQLLGHASVSTTEVYTYVGSESLGAAVAAAAALR